LPALAVALAVGACTTSQIDQIPTSMGGIPEGAPARPETPPPFPAVHDMPPARAGALLDADQQKSLEQELTRARDRQTPEQAKKASQAGKKAKPATKPSVPRNTGQNQNP
jgi:hypothetical protein